MWVWLSTYQDSFQWTESNYVGGKDANEYVYSRLKYLIIINILIWYLFFGYVRKREVLTWVCTFSYPRSMYRYHFDDMYVICAPVTPVLFVFPWYLSQLMVRHIYYGPRKGLDVFYLHLLNSNLTLCYQDILNNANVHCYITDLFPGFVLPSRYADADILWGLGSVSVKQTCVNNLLISPRCKNGHVNWSAFLKIFLEK